MLEQIETARDSKALLFVTGDRPGAETQIAPDVVDLFVDHLDAMWPSHKISLVIHTSGGNTASAWNLINLLRTFCEELEIVVVSKALSAGTLMCLGADRIVMTKQATLGPIDPSLNGPLNPQIPGAHPHARAPVSVEAVQGYLDVVKDFGVTDSDSLATVLNHLSVQIHPLVLGQIFRTRTQIRNLANRLLSYQAIEQDKREAIIQFLCSESGSHDHTINRREARELGLIVETPSPDFYALLRTLYDSISGALRLRFPYSPDTELAGNQAATYRLRRGLVESRWHGSHQFVTEGIMQQVQMPQPDGSIGVGLQDQRTFEAWRKEA